MGAATRRSRTSRWSALLALPVAVAGCAGSTPVDVPVTCVECPVGHGEAGAGVGDGDGGGGGGGAAESTADAGCGALPAADERLWPAPGELYYQQLGLGGLSMGESAVVVGPDGSVVLVDVGNDGHADAILDALATLNARISATPPFAPRAAGAVDAIVLTHFHADHADGLAGLLARVELRGDVIHRGFVDTGAANASTVQKVCAAPSGVQLCAGAGARCTSSAPSSGCVTPRDDLVFLGPARLRILAVDGWIGGESYEAAVGALGDDSNDENARSVVGLFEHGAFRLLFAGDLTGGGSGTADVEAFYAARLPGRGVGALGVDALHLSHHGRETSSSQAWLDALLPADGRSRNALLGISTAHLGSPHREVLSRLLDGARLGQGKAWATKVATGGATHARLVDARQGSIVVRTFGGGASYAVQAIGSGGAVLEAGVFPAVGACPE